MERYSLFELNQYIRRVISLNFSESVWVQAEIAQSNVSRGHRYLTLVEKSEEGTINAQIEAVCWAGQFASLKRKLGDISEELLKEGMDVLLHVKVDFHPRYGLKLQIEDIDPNYTLGEISRKRQEIIDSLKKRGLLTKNAELPLPTVIQRIALISSVTAAGKTDFIEQLQHNAFGYGFHITFLSAAVQGEKLEREILERLEYVDNHQSDFDAVAIIRGGGGKLDLGGFDSLLLGETISGLSLPVLSGIGHEIDETIVDLVANKALKTPTAVAEFIINHNLSFESAILETGYQIQKTVSQRFNFEEILLERIKNQVRHSFITQTRNADLWLLKATENLSYLKTVIFDREEADLNKYESLLRSLHPQQILDRGFSITSLDGQVLKDTTHLKSGDLLHTLVKNGSIESQVIKKD